jgi:hypothetical protein
MGNSKSATNTDNTSLAGICAKELTEGEINNSIFANFKNGMNIIFIHFFGNDMFDFGNTHVIFKGRYN